MNVEILVDYECPWASKLLFIYIPYVVYIYLAYLLGSILFPHPT